MMFKGIKAFAILIGAPAVVHSTSVKMDFLPFATVRTDPITDPTCLSDHVHSFYGAAGSVRPETTFADLRNATENSGNVEENKSLYWHPTIYEKVDGKLRQAPIWFGSAYDVRF